MFFGLRKIKMKIAEILKRMLVDRYCVICGEPVSYGSKEPVCKVCSKKWSDFLKIKCKVCGRERYKCSCLPSQVVRINHSIVSWSVFYDHIENREVNSLFSILKHNYDKEVIDFCTELMKRDLILMCKNRNIDYREYAITFAPRSRKNIFRNGFDQSQKLAKALAQKLNVKFVKAIQNVGSEEQKGLNKQERARNAIESYKFKENSIKESAKLFLVDDILTSGATLFACSFLLYKNGAKRVVPVVFAKDNYNFKRS